MTEYTYDANGNQLTQKVLSDANTAEAITTIEYDASGNVTSITDPEGNITRFTAYDSMGNALSRVDVRGKQWTYTYDDAGRTKTASDPLNNVAQFSYDELGNKLKQQDAEGHETTFEYDHKNRLIKSTDALGNATLFDYNSDDKLIKRTDPEGKVTRYEYDNEERMVKAIDGNGNEIVTEYNVSSGTDCPSCSGGGSVGQPTRVIYPTFTKEFTYDVRGKKTKETDILSATESYTTSFSYDSSGNLVSKTDKESKTTSHEFDALRRLKKAIDPLNQKTEYTYDDKNNLLSLKDARGNITWFEYDRNNRLIKETRPTGQEITYQYDGVENLIQKIDAKNQKTEYQYDDAGKLIEVRYFSATSPVKTVTFTYDKMGKLKTYNDGTSSAFYEYDNLYRKTSERVNYGQFQKSYSYEYYKNGMKKTFTGPDNVTYTYSYDANDQLTGIQIPGQGSITYTSYNWNQPTLITLPGGSRKDYVYDPLMRVKQITTKDPAQNITMNYRYTYDKMNNITSKQTEHGNYTYGYDDLYRLINDTNPTNGTSFTYDPVGNRVTSSDMPGIWTYNQNNELQGYNGATFQYDASGNTTNKTSGTNSTNYIYDSENRLVQVNDGSGEIIANYYYGPFGRRLWKEVAGTRTYFLYSDEGLIGEYDGQGAQTRAYGYMPNSNWTTDPLFMKQGTNYYFYHNDHLGIPQKMTETNGAIVWQGTYSAFGEVSIDPTSTITNNLRFPGHYFDEETGLHYNYLRYYDQKVGRYLSTDPIGFEGGDINLFAYVSNNPLKLIDPLGLTVVGHYDINPSKTCPPGYEEINRDIKIIRKVFHQTGVNPGPVGYYTITTQIMLTCKKCDDVLKLSYTQTDRVAKRIPDKSLDELITLLLRWYESWPLGILGGSNIPHPADPAYDQDWEYKDERILRQI